MRFSIIIPVHATVDRRNFYYDISCLDRSIMNQSFMDYEKIYVLDKCDYIAKAKFADVMMFNNKAKVIECNHGNAGLARNEGLNVAEGEYILFADDDDYILHPFVFE